MMNAEARLDTRLTETLERSLTNPLATPMVYRVKAGDTLSQIITAFYDTAFGSNTYRLAFSSVRYFNPQITAPNRIKPGQLIQLQPLDIAGYCPKPEEVAEQTQTYQGPGHILQPASPDFISRYQTALPINPEEQDLFWAMSWFEQQYGFLSTSAGAGLNLLTGLTSQAHNAFVGDVKNLWTQYQRGQITQNQYNYRRQLALKTYAQKIGPFEKIMFKGKTARESVRIIRSRAMPATHKIDYQLHRLNRLAGVAKHGGIALTVAGVGMGCYQISQTQNQQQKNEIFVETLGSTIVGVGSGLALTLILASNPVGWGVALVLGTAASVGSYAAGKGAKWYYNTRGEQVDLVTLSGVNSLCK